MSTATPEVKAEDSPVKEEAKKDVPETKELPETDETKTTEKAESSPIKTETTEPVAPAPVAEKPTEEEKSPASKDEEKVSTEVSADDIAKEIGAAMVSLAAEKKSSEASPPVETNEEPEEADPEVQAQLAKESSDEEMESEEESGPTQEGATGGWDNSYSTDLKKMYSDVDADTRAVAEEMIRAATGVKAKEGEDSESSKPEAEKEDETMEDADDSKEKKGSKDEEKPAKKPTVAKREREEPSALELALKQQGITQSDQLRSTQFPFRLHNMLDDAERSGHDHIVSWCPGGESFKIHKPAQLIQVLQKYFRQSKFKSFLRQLQGYNFKRITRGKDQGIVSHPLFLRGRRSVSTLMRRKRVGPKSEGEEQNAKLTAGAAPQSAIGKNSNRTAILGARPLGHPIAGFLSKAVAPPSVIISNPNAQDVLCVDAPNGDQVKNFQGNRKLASIVQKITGHYTSANESVRSMIVNEISGRIQNSGSRFLKLSTDGLSWVECNREEMFRKVIRCFEQEILSKAKAQAGEADVPISGAVPLGKAMSSLQAMGAAPSALTDPASRIPPRDHDVVLRGGPGSEKEGNTYLKTMIQANVGQTLDSFEMKRIKCRAILERMKRRGSRFFLKLKDTDSDDEMYILSDAEAQDIIYTAFCAEEKKVQTILGETPTSRASTLMRAKALAGLDTGHPGLAGLAGLGAGANLTAAGALGAGAGLTPSAALATGPVAFAAAQQQAAALQHSDAALLARLKANNEMNLLASQNALKRPLPGQHLSHESLIEKRLRAETDEHIKLLLERERRLKHRDMYTAAAGLPGQLPFGRNPALEASLLAGGPAAATASASRLDQLIRERQADELLLKQAAAARAPYAGIATTGLADAPNNSNRLVEMLKKKYNVKGAQERAW